MSRLINTRDLHNVVTKRKADYGKLATLIDNIVEGMVEETPTAIRIPKNATNGDIIKAMFPNKCPNVDFNENFGRVWIMVNGEDVANFRLDWWHSPYTRGII